MSDEDRNPFTTVKGFLHKLWSQLLLHKIYEIIVRAMMKG